jgi:energy-coupling factor transporter ATP-binding protein EcfA2
MIESILIKNFRGIQTGQIDRFRKFNLLVGPNNSGKSTVLEALYLATTADRPARITIPRTQNGYDGKISDSDLLGYLPMTRVLNRHNYEPSSQHIAHQGGLRISTNMSSGPLDNADITFKPVANRTLPDQKEIIALFGIEPTGDSSYNNPEHAYNNFAKQLFKREVGLSEWSRMVYCWLSNLTYFGSEDACWLVKGLLAPSRHTFLYDVPMMLGHLPMNFFRQMIKTVPGWSQQIAKHFRQVFGIDAPFNVQFLPPDQEQKWAQGWIAPENQSALTVDSYGDGARSTFKVLTPLLALAALATKDAPGLFIWEEPELFQNPRALGQLLAEVAALMKDKPMQLFIATHSLEVIANFTTLVQEGKIEREDLMAFRLGLQDGKLSSSWFNVDNLAAWLEEGLDPRVWGDFKSPLQFSFREEGEQ